MSEQDNNPQLEEETKNEEELEDESTEEESEESNDESEDSEDKSDSNEELERLRQENAKFKRLLAKKGDKPKEKKGADDDGLRQDVESLKTSERKRQFGYENELSPDEVDKVFQIDPNPSSKTLKDPFVKAGLEALRRQRRVGENTPSSSAKASPVSGKEFKNLSSTEKDKAWQDHLKSKSQS